MLKTDLISKRNQTHSQKEKKFTAAHNAGPPFQEILGLQTELAEKVIWSRITTGSSSSSLPQASATALCQTRFRGRRTTVELKDSQKCLLGGTDRLEFLSGKLHRWQNPMGLWQK